MPQQSHWNRHGRRSGGNRPAKIPLTGKEVGDEPMLSIQCFERRCAECFGTTEPFAPGQCGCPCHQKQEPAA